MADIHRRRRVKSDDDSEGSFSGSDVEGDDANETENSLKETPEKSVRRRRRVFSTDASDELSFSDTDSQQEDDVKLVKITRTDTLGKVAEGSEYESAEEQEVVKVVNDLTINEIETDKEPEPKEQESLSEIVDEEGGEEGIADTEDVEGDFLSGDPNDDASEDGDYVEEERQQGDGEECSPSNTGTEKELDFDEDRRNPQYIPKKGIFYEHDDRNNNEEVKEKEEEPTSTNFRDRKKKLWLDEGKWGHDRFREEEQYPKSKHELIETYGYDIRNEDGPPRARRRRRYGRGPTKYDRSWEDLTAYSREKFKSPPRGVSRGRRGVGRFRGGPRFRGSSHGQYNSENLETTEDVTNTDDVPIQNEIEAADDTETPVINNKEFPALPTKEVEVDPEPEIAPEQTYVNNSSNVSELKSVRTLTFENSNLSSRNSIERDVPPRRGKTPPFSGGHERSSGGHERSSGGPERLSGGPERLSGGPERLSGGPERLSSGPERLSGGHERPSRRPNPRLSRGVGRGEAYRRGRGNLRQISPRFLENKINNLNADMEQLSIEANDVCNDMGSESVHQNESNGGLPANTNGNELQSMALKGAGDSSGRPKRYSSLRQRSLPETSTYQAPPQSVPPPHPSYYEAGYQTTLYAPTDTCVPTPSTQSQTVTSNPILNPPYQTFTPPPYTDGYGLRMPVTPPPRLFPQVSVPAPQPLLAPPPCITPAPNIMSFAPPPPPAGYQFAYQQYATPPPPPPPAPPSDIYQTGITYYYPQSQAPPVRPTVQKRPKAAIPILPPPEREAKRNDKKDSNTSSNSRNFPDNSNDPGNVEVSSLRTEASPQLQPTVGVES